MTEQEELISDAIVVQQDNNNKNIAGSETTRITIHRTSYTDNYPRIIDDKLILSRPSLISIDTIFQIINCIALIALNILVILYYDRYKFTRSDIFWAIFVFSSITMMNIKHKYYTIIMISEIGQYIIYLWFSQWNTFLLIIFSILLFIMFSCKLLPRLIIRFCIDPTLYIINEQVSKKRKNIIKYEGDFNCNCQGIFIVVTTLPLFYYNQNRIWGEIWFAIIVVLILFYHEIIYLGILLFKDYYIRQLMDNMINHSNKLNYYVECDKESFEAELRKWINNDENLKKVFIGITTIFVDTMIIPLLYDLMLLILLIRYLIIYHQNEMTQFEYIYSIILSVLIGIAFFCFLCFLCATKLLNIRINRH